MTLSCKMCGKPIDISQGKTIGTCCHCGSVMTLPHIKTTQQTIIFDRATQLRRSGAFDQAADVYRQLLHQNSEDDAEIYWCLALCQYGVQYIHSPETDEWLPVCHRKVSSSFLTDHAYLATLSYCNDINQRLYQDEAQVIENSRITYLQSVPTATGLKCQPQETPKFIESAPAQTRPSTRNSWLIGLLIFAFVVVLVLTPFLNSNRQHQQTDDASVPLKSYQDDLEDTWNHLPQITSIAAGEYQSVGLKTDGTVVVAGNYSKSDVSTWKGIISIATGDNHTVGLKNDGTVVGEGTLEAHDGVSNWSDILAVSAGHGHTVGLKADGSVVAVGSNHSGQCDVSTWANIIAIAAGASHTVGLKYDGTVIAVGNNDSSQCEVSHWTDIIAIAAGPYCTLGLKADGTVVIASNNSVLINNVTSLTDIVAISAGAAHVIGLKADGAVVAIGSNARNQCDVSDWNDIVAIAAGDYVSLGLKADGTVVAVGYRFYGLCNVSDWHDILIP